MEVEAAAVEAVASAEGAAGGSAVRRPCRMTTKVSKPSAAVMAWVQVHVHVHVHACACDMVTAWKRVITASGAYG